MPDHQSDNPYAAPTQAVASQQYDPSQPRRSSFVWQVQMAAVAMIVQGSLELFYSAYLLLLFIVMPNYLPAAGTGNTASQQQMVNLVFYYMGVGGAVLSLIAIARIAAGIYGIQYRRRLFGIIVNLAGLLSVFSCYCLPSATAVCIYTCIIFFNGDVVRAFKMRAQGSSSGEIGKFFSQ